MFREHIAIGAIVSTAVCVAVYFYALITDPILLLFLFGVTIIGSFLPDVDSDSGMPFYLVYGTASLATTGVVSLYVLSSDYAADWRYLTGLPLATLMFFWFIVGGIVKRCTHHRGIFHSLPATAIAGAATLLIARYYGLPEGVAYIFGGAMAAGYLCHLILDELHAGITLDGIPFNPKKSLGTALKLFSDSNRVNTATYLVLAALVYSAAQTPVAEAYFYNDSEIIEIGDGVPKNVVTPSVTEGGYLTPPPDEDDEEGEQEVPPEDEPIEEVTPGDEGYTNPPDESDEEADPVSDEDAFEVLLESGAVVGGELLTASGFFEESLLAGFGFGGGMSGFGGASLFIYGSRVREALRGSYNVQDALARWREGRTSALTARGYGLVAASTALRDRNVDYIAFSASAFELTYRSRGYLFGIIPISFPVRITVVPEASERVTVRLPWYRFFVREFFTARSLAAEIDSALMEAAAKNTKPESDLKAVLFEAVVAFLKQKVGTISNTILSGS